MRYVRALSLWKGGIAAGFVYLITFLILFVIAFTFAVILANVLFARDAVDIALQGVVPAAGLALVISIASIATFRWLEVRGRSYFRLESEMHRGSVPDSLRTASEASPPPIQAALKELGLQPGASAQQIRERYGMLIHRLHPDQNGGDRSNEAELRRIIAAFRVLRRARSA